MSQQVSGMLSLSLSVTLCLLHLCAAVKCVFEREHDFYSIFFFSNIKNVLVGVSYFNARYCVNYVLLNFFGWFSGWCLLSQIAAFVLKFLSVEEKLLLLH